MRGQRARVAARDISPFFNFSKITFAAPHSGAGRNLLAFDKSRHEM